MQRPLDSFVSKGQQLVINLSSLGPLPSILANVQDRVTECIVWGHCSHSASLVISCVGEKVRKSLMLRRKQ